MAKHYNIHYSAAGSTKPFCRSQ